MYGSGVFRSSDNGAHWTSLNTPVSQKRDDMDFTVLCTKGSTVLAGGANGNILISYDNGNTWVKTAILGTEHPISCLEIAGNKFFSATEDDGVYEADSGSIFWHPSKTGLQNDYITSLAYNNSNLFCTASFSGGGLYTSGDLGTSWNQITLPGGAAKASFVTCSGNKVFVSTDKGVFSSTDNGSNWTALDASSSTQMNILAVSGSDLIASDYYNIYTIPLAGGKWNQITQNFYATAMCAVPRGLFIGARPSYSATDSTEFGIYFTNDEGATWQYKSNGLSGSTIQGFAFLGDTLLAISPSQGLF